MRVSRACFFISRTANYLITAVLLPSAGKTDKKLPFKIPRIGSREVSKPCFS
jgi:hypothetical protein